MKMKNLGFIVVFITFIVIAACSPRYKYQHRLKKGLESGVRYDSLFQGLYLGMSSRDFYIHCWLLNAQGLVKQGPNNFTVEYKMKHELKYPATMQYYPEFMNDRIYEMPVRFMYNGWAPWNEKLSADSLELDVLRWFKKVYGNDFIKVKHPEKGTAYVKVDGNRRITIFKQNDLYVWAYFTDMSVKQNLNDTTSQAGMIHNKFNRVLGKKNE